MKRNCWTAVLIFAIGLVGLLGCQSDEADASALDKDTAQTGAPDYDLGNGPVLVRMATEAGSILIEMRYDLAPHHVENFVHLGVTDFYNGTIFHRVIPGFMIQGGDPNSRDDDPSDDGQGGPTWADVLTPEEQAVVDQTVALLAERGYAGLSDRAGLKAEFNPTHHHRGAMSMARSRHPDSAGSQFFLCVADAPHLDNQYTYFGSVVVGMDAADAIVSAPRGEGDYPDAPVRITGFELIRDVDHLTEAERTAWDALKAADGS